MLRSNCRQLAKPASSLRYLLLSVLCSNAVNLYSKNLRNFLRHLVICALCVDMLLQNCFGLVKDHCAFMLCDVVL